MKYSNSNTDYLCINSIVGHSAIRYKVKRTFIYYPLLVWKHNTPHRLTKLPELFGKKDRQGHLHFKLDIGRQSILNRVCAKENTIDTM